MTTSEVRRMRRLPCVVCGVNAPIYLPADDEYKPRSAPGKSDFAYRAHRDTRWSHCPGTRQLVPIDLLWEAT